MESRKLHKGERGFVILFAVAVSSILLAISLGVANIALNEIKFGTSARDANDAFFAADTGAEYVLFNDKPPTSAYPPVPGTIQTWNLTFSGLGNSGQSCARVSIEKNNMVTQAVTTTIVSKGYNIGDASCNSSNPQRIERELRIINNIVDAPSAPASGGTITTVGPDTVHTFTLANCPAGCTFNPGISVTSVRVLVVGGGGGGGAFGGGGGAGGYVYNPAFPVAFGNYNVTVGAGGGGGASGSGGRGLNGSNSVFSTITATGGGGGAGNAIAATSGGSGGGGSNGANFGTGTPSQGNRGGGNGSGDVNASGGGGSSTAGITNPNTAVPREATGVAGGNGTSNSISGAAVIYAGGGGSGGSSQSGVSRSGGAGGTGGGGNGGNSLVGIPPTQGAANTGGGGGGGGYNGLGPGGDFTHSGRAGGSGIVIIRYITPP